MKEGSHITNLIGYVHQKGGQTFQESPFNEIDSAVLSQLSYLNFDILQSKQDHFIGNLNNQDTLKQASQHTWRPDENVDLVKAMATSKRFGSVTWHDYINITDSHSEQQFAAITFDLNDDYRYIAYRGTEASFVSWKEDLNMAYLTTIPSQLTALKYYQDSLEKYPGKYLLGGHSKGGTLAIYTGANASPLLKQKIVAIYNHDGSGMLGIDTDPNWPFEIYKTVPQSSIVGVTLDTSAYYKIVKSNAKSIFQHDLFTWEIEKDAFISESDTTWLSKKAQQATLRWILQFDQHSKQLLIDTLYQMLKPDGCNHIRDLRHTQSKSAKIILNNLLELDPITRKQCWITIKTMFLLSIN